MNFKPTIVEPMSPKYLVGVAIKNNGHGGMHVGLIYTHSSGLIKFAHLAWHNDLRDDAAPNHEPYLWADCEWLSDPGTISLAESVTNFVEMCVQTKAVPYGPCAPVAAFDDDGHYVATNQREGLTCASFIASVLDAAGFPVVKLPTWQKRNGDDDWWAEMARVMEKLPSSAARAEELKDISIEYRLRPDEVAVAAVSPGAPLQFDEAKVQAAPLYELLFPQTTPLPANDLASTQLSTSPTGSTGRDQSSPQH